MSTLILGTRNSPLARWQSEWVANQLRAADSSLDVWLQPFVTQGDRNLQQALPAIGGKGLFTAELEAALLSGQIDLAVHSLKDLPTNQPAGLTLGAICNRTTAQDVFVSVHYPNLASLPPQAVVGSSSPRRQAQLLALRPDLDVRSVRGNIATRLEKLHSGPYHALILAAAGLVRLGLADHIREWLPFSQMLPAPGQGALAVQCRATDTVLLQRLQAIHEPLLAAAVTAERALLTALGGGCSAPIAAYAAPCVTGCHSLTLHALLATATGELRRCTVHGNDPLQLGQQAAAALTTEICANENDD